MEQSRKIKGWCFTSLNGKVSRACGDIDFVLNYIGISQYDYGLEDFLNSISCGIISRKFYEALRIYGKYPLAQKPCYIITEDQSPIESDDNLIPIVVSQGNNYSLMKSMRRLQQIADGDIWLIGGHELLVTAFNMEIITELTINILPIFLGNGLPLFPTGNYESNWTTVSSHKFDNGVLQIQIHKKENKR